MSHSWPSIVAFRIALALLTQTTFQPDEFYQSLEPAHHLVFGYGHLTWEWLAPNPIRSIFYPLLNVPVYLLLKSSGMSEAGPWGRLLVVVAPKVLHGSFAALTDIFVYETARKSMGPRYASTALFLSLTSFFNSLSLSRSLSNSLETSLCTVAFAYYPWDASSKMSSQILFYRPNFRKVVIFAALACMVRPTNAVIWIFLFSRLLYALRSRARAVTMALTDLSVALLTSVTLLAFLDSLYYGQVTLTTYNFFKANASSVSLFYGSNPWHFYASQALPILTTTALPFVLMHGWTTIRGKPTTVDRNLWSTIIWTSLIYSLAGHKEWRFLHPILPLLHLCAAKTLVDLSPSEAREGQTKKVDSIWTPRIRPIFRNIVLLNMPVALYIMLLYCSAPISVMGFIRNLPASELQYGSAVGFVMPCHSTPGHAYLHREELAHGNMWSIGCEPPLRGEPLETYEDQTRVFFTSPSRYFTDRFPKQVNPTFPKSPYPSTVPGGGTNGAGIPWRHEWPRYLVLFGALLEEEDVHSLLLGKGYEEIWSAGRSWEGDTDERKGGVRVWKWNK